MKANTTTTGMARYLTDPPKTATQEHQQARRTANEKRQPGPVTEIASKHGMELRKLARDLDARRARFDDERNECDRRVSAREAARVQRAKEALEHRTEIADPTSRGMSRYRLDRESR
ncbi:hypothetical protein CH296_19795 [Rhodococcus sp. 14-2496-1d]|uniref:hypothetical protein n=1 Tax=Rhodococcus sp. 14-2496-1d TaxID=2023146 RepID=UPI000B9B2FAA|nr:hypothetical protein [Rhodococcus sp. 14-2496-1d]OZF28365.1 hypothetical protein CH296_19795 [Rhodococcus sp. 14-2496-1d]